ncbi:MAG: zinc ribbon domain-containing protein [Clostridium sp.]|nr:zinc ribbon domain-containing protein [Clostridium sp.]
MYCKNCGKQIEEESRFCQYCGAINESAPNQEMQKIIPDKKEKKKRKNKKTVIIIVIAIFIVLGAIIFFSGDDSSQAEQFIDLVQNGYLGNYDTVTIKEVLEYVDEDAEWNAGEAVSGDHYIVECEGSEMTIQFSVDSLEEELFKVTGIQIPGIDSSDMKAYDVKIYLDNLYQIYANAHPEKGLYIDVGISNDTLEGHVGPVRAAEKSLNTQLETDEAVQDLYAYADYTEDELIREFNYEKNEYGIYPEETHANFYFMDGKLYMLTISKPEDMEISLCGVNLQDSVEEADAILKSKGFICEGSYETAELAKDGSLDTVDVTVISYLESKTGYPYYIYTDVDHTITSLSYGLEAEEAVFMEEQTQEENWDFITEPLTYGLYSYDDGMGTSKTAEVGFSTDEDGGDYIYIECWRNDREIVFFSGALEDNGESYYAYCEDFDSSILVTFADGGLYVQLMYSNVVGMDSLEGFYSLTKALNLNEVS